MTYQNLKNIVKSIKTKTNNFSPQVAVILGSGLGDFAERIESEYSLAYSEIEGMPTPTVAGHKGRFVFGRVNGVNVAIMQGRIHYYEGYTMAEVVCPVRILALLGATKLIVTNVAGAINTSFKVGDLMVITDHIMTVENPLIGKDIEELGERFPDMSYCYNSEMSEILKKEGKRQGLKMRSGVYIQLSGASFETPSEVKVLRTIGADAVGMSTACEVVAARQIGMEVCGISTISNMAAGIGKTTLDYKEVFSVSNQNKDKFIAMLTAVIKPISMVNIK